MRPPIEQTLTHDGSARRIVRRRNGVIRLSLTASCTRKCCFCHNEGNTSGKDIADDHHLEDAVRALCRTCGFDRLHLTGGEPTAHPGFGCVVSRLARMGIPIAMTTNGDFTPNEVLPYMSQMTHVNFSLHSLDEETKVSAGENGLEQASSRCLSLRDRKANLLLAAKETRARINCVVHSSQQDILPLYSFAKQYSVPLRLLAAWQFSAEGNRMIHDFLRTQGLRYTHSYWLYPGSNIRDFYEDSAGFVVEHKLLHPYCLEALAPCSLASTHCREGFAFVRLEGDPIQVRLCVHRQGPPSVTSVGEFLRGKASRELNHKLSTTGQGAGLSDAPARETE